MKGKYTGQMIFVKLAAPQETVLGKPNAHMRTSERGCLHLSVNHVYCNEHISNALTKCEEEISMSSVGELSSGRVAEISRQAAWPMQSAVGKLLISATFQTSTNDMPISHIL